MLSLQQSSAGIRIMKTWAIITNMYSQSKVFVHAMPQLPVQLPAMHAECAAKLV
jgi:hypothetical protein